MATSVMGVGKDSSSFNGFIHQTGEWLKAHQLSVIVWIIFGIIGLIIYHMGSDGDFSFLMTLSSLISMFGFCMILLKVWLGQSVSGVSLEMLETYVILLTCRLFSIVPYEGYLPYDRSGDWLYQTIEGLSCAFAIGPVFLARTRFKSTYESNFDSLRKWWFLVPCLLLAIVIHPTLNGSWPSDVAWAFALYAEAFAVLPQLFFFQKAKQAQPFTAHFLAAQAAAKTLAFVFWLSTYTELNTDSHIVKAYVGHWVVAAQLAQLLIMADFIYNYVRCLQTGVSTQFLINDTV